jgi:hypothetical protein
MLKTVNTSDKNLQLIQDYVNQALTAIQLSTFQGGVLLADVALTTAGTQVVHTLGRTPKVCFPVLMNADSRVWVTASDSKTVTLDCSANVTVSLWVF